MDYPPYKKNMYYLHYTSKSSAIYLSALIKNVVTILFKGLASGFGPLLHVPRRSA